MSYNVLLNSQRFEVTLSNYRLIESVDNIHRKAGIKWKTKRELKKFLRCGYMPGSREGF